MSNYDTVGDWGAALRFQDAYKQMAWVCFGIPVGHPVVVTAEQDKFLCQAAVEFMSEETS